MRSLLILILLALFASDAEAKTITAQEAVDIAKKDAWSYNIDLTKYNIAVIKNDTLWGFLDTGAEKSARKLELEGKTKDKEFWSVSFYRKEGGHDGRVTIYIDALNGDIIGYEPYSTKYVSELMKKGNNEIPLDDVIRQADSEMKKRGYDLSKMVMMVQKDDLRYLDRFPANNVLIRTGIDNVRLKINKHRFWAVYYHPKGVFDKGDICIIIDVITGGIMSVFE